MSKRRRNSSPARRPMAAPQAALLAPDMMRMLATPGNDITIPNYGTVLRSEDETLLAKGGARGIRLYDEVRRDGHCLSVLSKRIAKVVSREWAIDPASDSPLDELAADLVRRQLKRLPFDRLCTELLWAVLYGYSVAEIEWKNADGETAPSRIMSHQRARFTFDLDWRPRLLTTANIMDGEALPERKFIVHRHDPEGSDPYGRGLGRVLFWHVLFKREGIGFWAHFLEKYASPTPVGKYPMGTPPAEQARLLNHLLDLVQRGALAVPIGTEVSFLEAARTGAATYEEWCNFWNSETSVAVMGETLSTSLQGQGARAAVETHDEVSSVMADSDADLLASTLKDQLICWIVEFNLPGAGIPSIWFPRSKNQKAEEEQRTRRAERQKKEMDNLFDLAGKGYRPAEGLEAALSEVLGTDIVADDLLRERFAPQPPVDIMTRAMSSTALTPEFATHADHGVGDIADMIEAEAQGEIEGWLAHIRDRAVRMVDAGADAAAVRHMLLEAYADLDVTPLGEIIGPGLALANLTGRADVLDETGEKP